MATRENQNFIQLVFIQSIVFSAVKNYITQKKVEQNPMHQRKKNQSKTSGHAVKVVYTKSKPTSKCLLTKIEI